MANNKKTAALKASTSQDSVSAGIGHNGAPLPITTVAEYHAALKQYGLDFTSGSEKAGNAQIAAANAYAAACKAGLIVDGIETSKAAVAMYRPTGLSDDSAKSLATTFRTFADKNVLACVDYTAALASGIDAFTAAKKVNNAIKRHMKDSKELPTVNAAFTKDAIAFTAAPGTSKAKDPAAEAVKKLLAALSAFDAEVMKKAVFTMSTVQRKMLLRIVKRVEA